MLLKLVKELVDNRKCIW